MNNQERTTLQTPVLDLQSIVNTPEAKVTTEFTLDLSALDFFGATPIDQAVHVTASVTNHAGALHLTGQASSLLNLCCDRCNGSFSQEKTILLDSLVAAELEDEENEEILLLDKGMLHLDDIATTAFILEMDTKTLCKEDCKGLCPKCGTNLNETDCDCVADNDSPFAALASLLEK